MAEMGSQSKESPLNLSFLTRSRPNKWDLSPNSVWQDMNGLDELIRLVRIIKKLIWMWYFALFNWFSNVKCQIWGKISRSQIIYFLLLQRISVQDNSTKIRTKGYEISVSEFKTRFGFGLNLSFWPSENQPSWGAQIGFIIIYMIITALELQSIIDHLLEVTIFSHFPVIVNKRVIKLKFSKYWINNEQKNLIFSPTVRIVTHQKDLKTPTHIFFKPDFWVIQVLWWVLNIQEIFQRILWLLWFGILENDFSRDSFLKIRAEWFHWFQILYQQFWKFINYELYMYWRVSAYTL